MRTRGTGGALASIGDGTARNRTSIVFMVTTGGAANGAAVGGASGGAWKGCGTNDCAMLGAGGLTAGDVICGERHGLVAAVLAKAFTGAV
jgi:hypothetical protein